MTVQYSTPIADSWSPVVGAHTAARKYYFQSDGVYELQVFLSETASAPAATTDGFKLKPGQMSPLITVPINHSLWMKATMSGPASVWAIPQD